VLVGAAGLAGAATRGVDDLAGNAFQWTTSSLAEGEYVARGGAYFYDRKTNQTTNRQVSPPSMIDVALGLRVCATWAPAR
jgi:formylglycine-generating enzyme required for sulfatase activity